MNVAGNISSGIKIACRRTCNGSKLVCVSFCIEKLVSKEGRTGQGVADRNADFGCTTRGEQGVVVNVVEQSRSICASLQSEFLPRYVDFDRAGRWIFHGNVHQTGGVEARHVAPVHRLLSAAG